jgi:thymidylate synthase ThyX
MSTGNNTMRQVEPRVYIIGSSHIEPGLWEYLRDIGHASWDTNTRAQGDVLSEVAGRLCYRSWSPFDSANPAETNQNLSRVREGNAEYLANTLRQGHGSIFEHTVINVIFRDVSRVFTHELVRHRAGCAYCLAGDAVVYSGSKQRGKFDGVKRRWTMKQLYEKTLDYHGRSRLKLITVRCFDGDRFVAARLAGVFQSGEKDIFRVTLGSGKSIRCSKDHLFLTEDGWRPCRELGPGARLATNGRRFIPEDERQRIAERMTGAGNHRWQGDDASRRAGYLRALKLYPDLPPCEDCGSSVRVQRHHIDRNPLNNERSNLEFLCEKCHHKRHDGEPGKFLTVKWDEIISITSDGHEMTYDIEVDHPAHNFVASGIVTHNSQESMRFVRPGSLGIWVPTSIKGDTEKKNLFMHYASMEENFWQAFCESLGIVTDADFATKKQLTSLARRLSPAGTATTILASLNIRAWRHVLNMRADNKSAEEEMVYVMNQLAPRLKEQCPAGFQDLEFQGGHWVLTINPKV